jgi:hypothetical protein
MLLWTGPGFAAEGLDITLTNDSVIQDRDNYDDVFVHGDDTVVNVTGGTIGELWSRDGSTIHISGGRITYAQSHDRSTINVTGGIVTKPSISDAGRDRTVITPTPTVAQVTLDGSASIDLDGDPLTYEWTWILNGYTFRAYGPEPTIMLPVGKHTFDLIVSDGTADSKADQVVITVQTLDQRLHAIRAEKLRLIDAIDGVLEKEQQVATVLSGLLASGNFGNLPHDDIVAAREAILSSIQHQEQARKSLQASIQNLDDAILLTASTTETTKAHTPVKK